MKYPDLVPKAMCKTPVTVVLNCNDINKYGEPETECTLETTCNYQDSAETIRVSEKEFVKISGKALFTGDLAEELPVISGGSVTVFGVKRSIVHGIKARNPDGTVNYTELKLE
ncbi:MAG: hypothetical protein IJ899_00450 [Blautia sp.]|nr:hypothetical protein [Blautia sp.]